MKSDEDADTTQTRYCRRCGGRVRDETVRTDDMYPFVCDNCDENLFEFETMIEKDGD